ncbi:GNAT family N-acetyltransferase [Neisseria sp.]|uniref:GNAT family N-acetyltransferase n=1 Tax=Neisseria sp. TaxID=192066 RepID=UPI00359F76A1
MWHIKSFAELTTLELWQIYHLRTAVFVVEQHCPYQEVDEADLSAIHLFAKNHEKPIAYSRIIHCEDCVKIGRVVVAVEARGSGLARELMSQAVKFAEKFAKPIKIQAQSYLQGFYESFGFNAASEIYLEDGIPHLDMFLNPSPTQSS